MIGNRVDHVRLGELVHLIEVILVCPNPFLECMLVLSLHLHLG